VVEKFKDKASISSLCSWTLLPESVFYYKPRNGKRGARPSTHTSTKQGELVPNEKVIEVIKVALSREFCCYGYHNITDDLRDLDYIINHKKVYRLMDENNLLLGKVIRANGKREFVKQRKIEACRPMECLCLDIKYVWVHGERKNYYLLTILDVYSRKALEQIFKSSIRKMDVINLFRRIKLNHGIKGVTVRNDNGSQFIANDVKQFLRLAEANQEFTHIATPEENAYIEAFHSIVEREVIQRFEFTGYYDAKLTFEAHLKWYNYTRKHGRIGRVTPHQKWMEYYNAQNIKFAMPDKAEAGSAGEQPVRNNPANEDVQEGMEHTVPSILQTSLLPMPKKTSFEKEETDLNSFEKTLQKIRV
jgi:putative transposase